MLRSGQQKQCFFQPRQTQFWQRSSRRLMHAYLSWSRKEPQPLPVQWMPQPVADWLYQASHYAIPLIQAALGTKKAFDKRGQYLDAAGCPASGGQIVAFWGTEMASRRERGLFAHDNDMDWQIFITPDFDFHQAWLEIKKILDPLGLLCTGPVGCYYRISPMQPLTFNAWDEH